MTREFSILHILDASELTCILLGGGFKYVLFSPLFGEDCHFDYYFSDWLVQPPNSLFVTVLENLEMHLSFPP